MRHEAGPLPEAGAVEQMQHQAAWWTQQPGCVRCELRQRGQRVEGGEGGDDAVELRRRQARQLTDIHDGQIYHTGQPMVGDLGPGLCNHGRRDVDGGDADAPPRQEERIRCGATAHVEHVVARAEDLAVTRPQQPAHPGVGRELPIIVQRDGVVGRAHHWIAHLRPHTRRPTITGIVASSRSPRHLLHPLFSRLTLLIGAYMCHCSANS